MVESSALVFDDDDSFAFILLFLEIICYLLVFISGLLLVKRLIFLVCDRRRKWVSV